MPGLDTVTFRQLLQCNLREAWSWLQRSRVHEQLYAFGIRTTELAWSFEVAACSEQGLDAVTARHVAHTARDPALQRSALRWNIGESPLLRDCLGLLTDSQLVRDAGFASTSEWDESPATLAAIFDACCNALRALDRDGAFGAGEQRERLVLGVWLDDGPAERMLDLVRHLNPPATVTRFAAELYDGCAAHEELKRRYRLAG